MNVKKNVNMCPLSVSMERYIQCKLVESKYIMHITVVKIILSLACIFSGNKLQMYMLFLLITDIKIRKS